MTLSARVSPVEPKHLLWERSGFKYWFCHPKLSRFSCLTVSSYLIECQRHHAKSAFTALLYFLQLAFPTFLGIVFMFSGVAVLFCFNLFASSSQSREMWVLLSSACTSGIWSLGFDSQVGNPVMLPWTWLNGHSGLADLWLFLPMFDLSKQTALM